MKIRITREELNRICSDSFGQTVTWVTIAKEKVTPPLAYTILKGMQKAFNTTLVFNDFIQKNPHLKLEIIKKLRELTRMGLRDTKYAVENWERWFKWVNENGSIPRMEHLHPLTGEKYISPIFLRNS